MAAASAGERGKKVLLLEKNKKLGVKILMSGGTRCNITHNCSVQGIIEGFGRGGKFLHSALASLPPLDVIQKIESQGVATKIESTGKVFPISNKAIDVRDALVGLAQQANATILNECPVSQIERGTDSECNRFAISTPQGRFETNTVVITTGGKSYPGCGTTGDGYGWAKQFGHSIVETFPALVPIISNCDWALDLKGITIDRVNVQVIQPPEVSSTAPSNPSANSLSANSLSVNSLLINSSVQNRSDKQPKKKKHKAKKNKAKVLSQREASFLFTHWGFSGPSVLDVSREVAQHPFKKSLELVCDFLPDQTPQQFADYLQRRKSSEGKQSAGNLLNEFFPKRFAEALLRASETNTTLRNADLSKKTLLSIGQQVKAAKFPINGTLGFEKAEVTSGGVSLKEVDSKTMQSKFLEGLFFAGEILDLDGRIGGFNFQSAFSTGWLAGQWV